MKLSNVGPYPIVATLGINRNYDVTATDGTLTITKATLTVTADDQTKVYGETNPALTFKYSGFKGTDSAADLTTPPTCTTEATQYSGVAGSPYAITCSGGADDNYAFTYVDGKLTITKATLTVTADDQTKVYGETNPALTFKYSGFKGTDSAADLTTPPTCTTEATQYSGVAGSPYAITCSGGADDNYAFTYVDGKLTITKATLTVTADDQTKVYGETNPALTFKYSGFKGTDSAADLTTPPTCTTEATQYSGVAGSPYTITCSGGADDNYAFTYVDGKLTITKATLTVTADDQTKVYGETNPALTFKYSGFKGTDSAADLTTPPTCTTEATQYSGVAGSPYAITCSGGADDNYAFTYVDGKLTITKANPTCTVTGYSVYYDGSPHTATGSCKGVQLETLAGLDRSATTHTLVGTYNDTWTFTDVTGNYNNASGSVTNVIKAWTVNGYYQPVDMNGVLNTVKGGSTVPLKFNVLIGGANQTSTSVVKLFLQTKVNCDSSATIDEIEIVSTGGTSLRYDASGGQFIQNWQTPKTAGFCYKATVTMQDGTSITANFKLK